jgi:hypothetical protein
MVRIGSPREGGEMARISAVVVAAVIAIAGTADSRARKSEPSIIGTWLLESIVDTLSDGSLYYWMGRQPVGAIMYDATGHMGVQFMRDPRPAFAEKPSSATLKELRAAYDGYYSYFGRYSVSATGDSVTHFVQASHRPEEVGITYHRGVKVMGDRLFIDAHVELGGVPRHRVLTWKRAR